MSNKNQKYCFEYNFLKKLHCSFNEYQIHQVACNLQHLKYTFEKYEEYILA